MASLHRWAVLTAAFVAPVFSAHASSYFDESAVTVPIVAAPTGETPLVSMTSSFSGSGFSGILRSAYGPGAVYYQVVNNADSTVSIGSLGYAGTSRYSSWTRNPSIPLVFQTNAAFDVFAAGQDRASLVQTDLYICGGGCHPDFYRQTINFKGGPANVGGFFGGTPRVVMGEELPGILPGTMSYTEVVQGSYSLGEVSIDGQTVTAFVAVVPEPETYALMLAGLCVIGATIRRRSTEKA